MKKIISAFLAAALLLTQLPLSTVAQEDQNLLRTALSEAVGVSMPVATGAVSQSDRFNGNGALGAVTDGDITAAVDVFGALDWETPRYIGVQFRLDTVYSCTELRLYSGYTAYTDIYRVYASTDLNTLYNDESIIADNLACNGQKTVSITGNYRYFAFFCTEYDGNQRVQELEIYGHAANNAEQPSYGLTVSGRQIIAENGQALTLKGVNITELSWSVYGDGSTTAGQSDADGALNTALNDWGCGVIRLAVNPQFYLNGGTTKNVTRTATQYRAQVDRFISLTTGKGVAVILDCHGYYGVTDTILAFWDVVAAIYDDNELVLYGLLNEPVSDWQTYYEGGSLTANGETLQTYGMTALLDRVRSVSDNIAVIGGIDFAFDLSCVTETDLLALAEERSAYTGMTKEEYVAAYFLGTPQRCGRGIVFDTHIYSGKPQNWSHYLGNACCEYPVLVGEFGPTYLSDGAITTLTMQEKAYLTKIFDFIRINRLSYTAWGMNAWPYLTTSDGTVTPFGTAVRSFIQTGEYQSDYVPNLLYLHGASCRPVAQNKNNSIVFGSNMFYNQASGNGAAIADRLIDGDTTVHYDIYEWDGYRMGMEYTLEQTYAVSKIVLTSGLDGLSDYYRIYASDRLDTLYNDASLIENLSTGFTGTVSLSTDRQVKYIAFLADGYVRIKEFEVRGTIIGDLDGNGIIDTSDMTTLRQVLLQIRNVLTASGDLNRDGKINISDLVRCKKAFSSENYKFG